MFGDIPNLAKITQFLMVITSVKPINEFQYDPCIQNKGELVLQVMHNFSYQRLQKVLKIDELEFIIKYLLDNHKDKIFELTSGMKTNIQGYLEVIESWKTRFTAVKLEAD